MVRTTQLTLGELETHCYLVWCEETLECLVVDPGDSGEYISEVILEMKLKPVAIILTHGHFDHCLGTLPLVLNFSIPVLIHQKDVFLLQRASKTAAHWLKHPVDPVAPATGYVDDSSSIAVGKHQLSIIETPGHTPGSICLLFAENAIKKEQFLFSKNKFLLSGDTLFKNGFGSTNHTYSSTLQLSKSLRLLKTLPPETVVLPGHGATTTIESEL